MSIPPPAPDSPRRRSRVLSIGGMVAIAALLSILGAIALSMPLLGFVGLIVMIGPLLFGIVLAMHYLVWGRWLAQRIADDAAQKEGR